MGAVTTHLASQARTIFSDLGYTVESAGAELRAERKWRTVHVTPMPEPREPPTSGEFRCFVTRRENVEAVRRRVTAGGGTYEWAVIGVGDDGSYSVDAASTR
jgi:hypothetical protein